MNKYQLKEQAWRDFIEEIADQLLRNRAPHGLSLGGFIDWLYENEAKGLIASVVRDVLRNSNKTVNDAILSKDWLDDALTTYIASSNGLDEPFKKYLKDQAEEAKTEQLILEAGL